MTFEDYEEKHLQDLNYEARRLVRMGWNARGGDHVAEASKMVHGSLSMMGNFTDEDGTNFQRAMVIEFPTRADFHAAMKAGQCRFTVFGGEG